MKGTDKVAEKNIDAITTATAAVAKRHPGLYIGEAGSASSNKALNAMFNKQLAQAGIRSVPLTLLILVLVFGSIVAAGVPLLLALTAVLATIGLLSLPSRLMPMDQSVSEVVLLIGLAVGVDYALFYLKREREERAAGRSHRAALEAAAATSGRSVLISGLTVMAAMAGLFFSGDRTFRSFGIGTIMVVAIAMLGSLTVLPALLSKLGDRVEKGRIPFLGRLRRPSGENRVVGEGAHAGAPPSGDRSRRVGRSAARDGGAGAPPAHRGVGSRRPAAQRSHGRDARPHPGGVRRHGRPGGDRGDDSDDRQRRVQERVQRVPRQGAGVRRRCTARSSSTSTGRTPSRGSRSRSPGTASTRSRTLRSRTLRNDVLPTTIGTLPQTEWAVTGGTAASHDYNAAMKHSAPIVFGFVLLLAFLLLLVSFRSIVIAAKAVVLNLLSVGAAYGVVIATFQWGWGENILNFRSNGGIASWLPIFMFVILFGLSMDYHVFILSRVREAFDRGMTTEDAVEHGIKTTAGTVSSAALVMVGAFGIFATLPFLDFKEMGIGLAAAVLIDATIVRAVLLPAIDEAARRVELVPAAVALVAARSSSTATSPTHSPSPRQPPPDKGGRARADLRPGPRPHSKGET